MCSSLVLAAPTPEPPEYFKDLIHSDVPLWASGEEIWPIHFTDKDSWGCSSRFAFGDWQVSEAPGRSRSWLRLQNYGVFHCAYIVRRAPERNELERSEYSYGWLVMVGRIGTAASTREFWVLQSGARPGSSYTLFAVSPVKGTIKAAEELQSQCPAGNNRGGDRIDIWNTRYCAINSRSKLIALAKKMAKIPPLATMRYVGPEAEEPSAKP
jgi:hypothetical protein